MWRRYQFDDAIESHRKAATALDEALQSPPNTNVKVNESIRLQRDFHTRHIELVGLKKVQYEKIKKALEQQRIKRMDILEHRAAKERLVDVCDMQIAIFKALDETDTLLDTLSAGFSKANVSDASTSDNSSDDSKSSNNTSKDDEKASTENAQTIDDMHRINGQLHVLIYNLVQRVDESSQEMEALRDRVRALEKERTQSRQVSLAPSNKSSSESIIPADESPTLSDCNETRRNSMSGEERKIILPESSDLPPLELPDFDYNISGQD